ncbi:conserved hypothetical protein [Candidatus Nitrotoga sp. BS]|uniref:hypothetical protein n=1 Tax=Candidatus Nitrotoga sp. BS TaxID=2890408 RepID=UPI001EF21A87|nr:hypothetical protein [Candidatus Nitrotoga sp. BS]CAH1210727.1 conserved hypothetical protein [Candidatus Nitrotoga sp. BS]
MTTKARAAVKALPTTKSKVTTKSLPAKAVANNKSNKPAQTDKEVIPSKTVTPTKAVGKMTNDSPVSRSAVTTAKVAKAGKLSKADKPKKIKMVRDSFSMPENEYSQFAALKKRCLQAGVHVKKSELLRAGLLSLSKLTDSELVKVVGQVEILKTGRPNKH